MDSDVGGRGAGGGGAGRGGRRHKGVEIHKHTGFIKLSLYIFFS